VRDDILGKEAASSNNSGFNEAQGSGAQWQKAKPEKPDMPGKIQTKSIKIW
jgi:hypothetical protein